MIQRVLLACAMLASSSAGLRWLLLFWTPRCNEECAAPTLVGMYGLVLVAAFTTLALAGSVALGRLAVGRGAMIYATAAIAVALVAAVITP